MKTLPSEFSELLTPRGLRLLETGRHPGVERVRADPAWRFLPLADVIDPRRAEGVLSLLERAVGPHLKPMSQPIPAETILLQEQNYADLLPKAVRVSTAMLESRRSQSWKAAEEIGLTTMLHSRSYRALAEVLAGRALRARWGIQALRYGPGDYTGPHNDAHPEDPDARDGYFDLHVSLADVGVKQQWIQYARAGHFNELSPLTSPGTLAAYRLPFWHSVGPLVPRPRQLERARRWVLLGTFLYAPPKPAAGTAAGRPGSRSVGADDRGKQSSRSARSGRDAASTGRST